MTDERALPKPQTNKPIVANPAVPGIQKPPNKPDGRSAPTAAERK